MAKIIPLHRCTEVEDCPTVRQHPRTLHGCDAAFPGDPEYSAVVERPAKFSMRLADLAVIAVSLACFLIVVVMAAHDWLPHE